MEIQVDQSAGDEQAMGVLRKAAIAHVGKSELPLHDAKRVLDLRPDPRLGCVACLLGLVQRMIAAAPAVRHVLRIGCCRPDGLFLALIGAVAPDLTLLAVEKIVDDLAVVRVGRRCNHGMNDTGAAIHADMGLHAEIPLIALLGLVHLGVTRAGLVFGRGRRVDDRRIQDGAAADRHTLLGQMRN